MESLESAKQIESYVVGIRRNLHENPELGGQLYKTLPLVKDELESMEIKTEEVSHGGLIGVLEGGRKGKTIILRADMDALPMKESETNLKMHKACVSKNDGAAHTCGHDGHTAMLLGAARILSQNRDRIRGRIIFAFEDGEENEYGMCAMLTRLVEIGADGIWGIHLQADVPSGKISVTPGPRMASSIWFDVKIKGRGGHGSRPDLANTPLDCFTDIYNNITRMRLNLLSPFYPITLSIGQVHMGSASNIIPEELEFGGTVRFLNYKESGAIAVKQLMKIVDGCCNLHDCQYEYVREPEAEDILVYNNEDCSAIAAGSVEKAIGKEALYYFPAWMASESMSLYMQYFPGIFAFLGIANEEKGTGAGHHSPDFDIDEDVLKLGVAATVQYALDFLDNDKPINFKPYDGTTAQLFKRLGYIG